MKVDNRNWEKYGSALLMTALSASIQYAGAKFVEITAAMIESTIDLKPIVRIASGTIVHIKPIQDWYIRPAK